nr:integrase, catalytic region, zinc finger, CCHC-type, peptidase aspartic, catalytic [Tanacetum cinerariifolium]
MFAYLVMNVCFFANHDACVVRNIKDVQKRKKAKSAKQRVKSEWKPIGWIFKTVGLKWIPMGRTFKLVGKVCHLLLMPHLPFKLVAKPSPKLSLRYANDRESLSRSYFNSKIHPFNLHDYGIKRILSNDEVPPWKFDYLRVNSRCSKHMIGHCDKFMYFVSKFIGTVRFGNDHFAAIMGYGDLQIGNILISRV